MIKCLALLQFPFREIFFWVFFLHLFTIRVINFSFSALSLLLWHAQMQYLCQTSLTFQLPSVTGYVKKLHSHNIFKQSQKFLFLFSFQNILLVMLLLKICQFTSLRITVLACGRSICQKQQTDLIQITHCFRKNGSTLIIKT